MYILIDDQIPVEVTPLVDVTDQDDQPATVLTVDDTHKILTAWKDLSIGRRDFTYGNDDSDTEPSDIIIAEATRHGLNFDTVDPFWDGGFELNAYDLDVLSGVLPLKVVD